MELRVDLVSREEPNATYRSIRDAQRDAFFSNAKAKRELGLPSRSLEESARSAVDWFRENGVA
jgi:nucleoside-diphosphate-sugar epimerase